MAPPLRGPAGGLRDDDDVDGVGAVERPLRASARTYARPIK